MILWTMLTVLCSAVAVAVSVPLIRRYEDQIDRSAKSAAVYEDQIKEVDKDEKSGTINAPEAAAAKAEIQKRIVHSAREANSAKPISPAWRFVALVATAGLVVLGGVSLYTRMGNPEMPSITPGQPRQTAAQTASNNNEEVGRVDAMIAKLRSRLQANPNDAEGWRMLGWALLNTAHFQESSDAYAKALAIDPNNVDYISAYVGSLIQAANGIVTPKAKELLARALEKNPKDIRARYYDALAHQQSGDQTGALDRWLNLLADTPADAGWRDEVKQHITELGKATGRDVSAALNAAPSSQTSQQPTPASNEKNAMVAGMIAKLAAKLEANPKDREGWAMMIRSLIVSGDQKGAEEALAKALDIFKDDPATVDGLKSVMQAATAQKTGK